MTKRHAFLFLTINLFCIFCACKLLFNDPVQELDPRIINPNDSLYPLPADTLNQVLAKKIHIVESFGSYGCVNCPDAEAILSPYFIQEVDTAGKYNPALVVINYHIKFSPTKDQWITANTQSVYDGYNYQNSLPELRADGSNSQYGFSENIGGQWKTGLIDSLLQKIKFADTLSRLRLSVDTSSISWDTTNFSIGFSFSAQNQDSGNINGLSFRIAISKNLPVRFDHNGSEVLWEAIVVEASEYDFSNNPLVINNLAALEKKTFSIKITVPDEAKNKVNSPSWGTNLSEIEKITNYALIIIAKDQTGIVQNVLTYNYNPTRKKSD